MFLTIGYRMLAIASSWIQSKTRLATQARLYGSGVRQWFASSILLPYRIIVIPESISVEPWYLPFFFLN